MKINKLQYLKNSIASPSIGKQCSCIVVILFFASSYGCKKYLDVNLPNDLVLTENVFSTNESANGAMLNVYGTMFNSIAGPYNIPFATGISGDELRTYNVSYQNAYLNSSTSSDPLIESFWFQGYNFIYQANAVYEGCASSNQISADVKKQLMGEALFMRAYWHFYLYNLYGDIPVVISTNYNVNAVIARKSKSEVYSQIISDLKAAIDGLQENYVAANGLTTSNERIRPNKAAAIAFLARVYLFNEEYDKAEEFATMVMSNTGYSLTDLSAVFLANSKEAIWQLKFTTGSFYNTPEGLQFILQSPPPTGATSALSSHLLSVFDSSDMRRILWIGRYTDNSVNPAKNYFYPFKYKIRFPADGKEYSVIFRLAEQYLVRAEARAQQNKLADAITDLDAIRKRAGLALLGTINPGIGKKALLDSILVERQRELFTEQGHRWFDLKRTKNVDEVMTIVTAAKGGPAWQTYKQLFPIPNAERISNPKLTQNDGYN